MKLFIKPLIQILNRNIISSISMFWERGLYLFIYLFDKPSVTKGPNYLSSSAFNFSSSYQFISISSALKFFFLGEGAVINLHWGPSFIGGS